MAELIVIMNKKGDILDFSPRNLDISKFLSKKPNEIYDDGELIRLRIDIANDV
ncbi:hypothetical protein [Saccharolobus caldissimus]|uniref:Uncharacterized protein n=1 Tax=Saccharolobus caldissimus TaxID=1702097 RepID=A0AAQ4CN72_9CREN|nr:hypothetical protein [Saccharolobus caldissimus]BDB97253.1 hypothetical protein SACC_02700 [Saccharolobus caldissimus]